MTDYDKRRVGWITRPDGKKYRIRPHGHPKGAKNTGICCPNYSKGGDSHCPESSLSTQWMISFQFELGEPRLTCFQCGAVIGEWKADKI